jgi:hypothetical protein
VLLQDDLGITTDLYTVQGYNLLEFRGKIDLAHGTYQQMPGVTTAQRRLYEMIGTDQVIWFSHDRPMLVGEVGRYLHLVRVDPRDAIAVVDTFAWNHIIGNTRYIPEHNHEKLKYDAAINSDGDYEETLRTAEDEYLQKHRPADPWSIVRKPRIEDIDDQVLTRFPLAFSTVVTVEQVTLAMSKERRRGW